MSDEEDVNVEDEDYVAPQPPPGYVPGAEQPVAGQSVEERGQVVPAPHEVLEEEAAARTQALEDARGAPGSPDTAAAGAEHEDR